MTYEQFFYWLKGFVDVSTGAPTEAQWDNIKKELEKMASANQKPNNFLTRQQTPPHEPFQPVRTTPTLDRSVWRYPYPDTNQMIGLTRDGVGVITAPQQSQP